MSRNPETPTPGFFTKWTIIGAFLLGLFIIIPTTMWLGVAPAWMSMEREAAKNSLQYTESKETMLLSWISEYTKLDAEIAKADAADQTAVVDALSGQQAVMMARITAEASRIPKGATISPIITDFLADTE